MKQGPKIKTAARLNSRLGILLVTVSSFMSSPALAITCEALIEVVSKRKAPKSDLQRVISIEKVFTFEVNADAMGFRPEKKILRATSEDLKSIAEITKGDSDDILRIANEMAYYLEVLPLTSVSEAFDVIKLRHHLKASPEAVRDTLQEALDIAYQPQSKNVQSFPPNTAWEVAHPHVLNLAAMHLSQEKLDFKQTRLAMRYLENSFPNAKRLHQLQALQIFLATKLQDESASFNAFVKAIKGVQSSLVIERRVVGFAEIEQIRPSLEEVLMLRLIASRAELSDADLIRAVNSIIAAHHPESFVEVAGIIGQGLSALN